MIRHTRLQGDWRSEEHTSELQSPCNLVCRIIRPEEHTSELQSPCNLVCRLLLEKKKMDTDKEPRWDRQFVRATAARPIAGRAATAFVFFFNDTATTEIYTLSLHDALPIWWVTPAEHYWVTFAARRRYETSIDRKSTRLNSSHLVISYAVFCLKKKTQR